MVKRIFAIAFIFVCTSVAWAILGGTVFSRTYDQDAVAGNRVASTWGTEQTQAPPTASYQITKTHDEVSTENNKVIVKKVEEKQNVPLSLEGSQIDVDLDLEHRQ